MKKNLTLVTVFALLLINFKLSAQTTCIPSGTAIEFRRISLTTVSAGVYKVIYQVRHSGGSSANGSFGLQLFCGGSATGNVKMSDTLTCSGAIKNFGGSLANNVWSREIHATFNIASCSGPGVKEIRYVSNSKGDCSGTSSNCIITTEIPLPVTYKKFDAFRSASTVSLSWSTATERNNSGFAVERNTNGTWQQIGWVSSQSQDGNSDALLNYTYTDMNNTKGVSQYRIRQVDHDSKASYSEVRSVRGESQPGKTLVYPNPSQNGKVNLMFEDGSIKRDVSVTDMSGRIVRQLKSVATNNVTLESLQPGMYIVRIVDVESGEQAIEKLMVSKQ